ncbi:MAG: hypothetical protein JO362_17745 [Streptomycetaceae bacterium]|nr:hypothetical protein [Streptomycetaceae bacterium]
MDDLADGLRLPTNGLDYAILVIYFVVVLGIGLAAKRSVKTSLDFFLSGRSLPAWVTGLAFISANLGATEILGMAANGAQYGVYTVHWYWVGAIPAMVFLGLVLMPFYYGSKVRSVPEFLLHRFDKNAHLLSSILFAFSAVLIAGVNLYAMAIVVQALLGWPTWVAILVAGLFVLVYITVGGLSSAIYNEVLQFFMIPSDQGANFISAIVGFVAGAVVMVAVSMVTKPKPVEELAGLVYGARSPGMEEAPAAGDEAWYRKPTLLGTAALVLAAALYLPFSF